MFRAGRRPVISRVSQYAPSESQAPEGSDCDVLSLCGLASTAPVTIATALFNTVQDRYRLPGDAFIIMFAINELRRCGRRLLAREHNSAPSDRGSTTGEVTAGDKLVPTPEPANWVGTR